MTVAAKPEVRTGARALVEALEAHDVEVVFGLPGNPVSSIVCFQLFVRPALAAMQHGTPAARPVARLAAPVAREASSMWFLMTREK